MNNISNWILTDDNSCQYVKCIEKDKFKLIEMSLYNPDTEEYSVYTDLIDVNYYLEDYCEEVEEILHSFGYGDENNSAIDEVNMSYPDPSQIIAECIFESGMFSARLVFEGSEEECKKSIENYISTH